MVIGWLKEMEVVAKPYCTVPATPEFDGRLAVFTVVVAVIAVKSEVDAVVIVVDAGTLTVDEPMDTCTG
jgi:hypothetical protein